MGCVIERQPIVLQQIIVPIDIRLQSFTRLPLVGEFPYSRGNEEFVGGRGNLRGKVDKMGELLENVRGFGQKSNDDK